MRTEVTKKLFTVADRLFVAAFGRRAVVSVQNPIQLNNYTEPQPDVVVLKPRSDDYAGKKARAEDALLLVEVSDKTLRYDRSIKLPRYAAAGIPEVWILTIVAGELFVYRSPSDKAYAEALTLRAGDVVSPPAFPDITFKVDEIL